MGEVDGPGTGAHLHPRAHTAFPRLRIGSIRLVGLDVRSHELRSNELDLVAKSCKHTTPMMRRSTSFHRDNAVCSTRKKCTDITAWQNLALHLTGLCLNPMHLKNSLCQIQTISRNVHRGSPVP
jgi:hypothetical protein